MTTTTPKDSRGLAGQTIGETEICSVNQTSLIYRGYEIADLAENATFEEVAHVLLVGHKPSTAELDAFHRDLASQREIPDGLKALLREIAAPGSHAHPMAILRTAVSYLAHYDLDANHHDPEAEQRKSRRLLAQIPTVIGFAQRVFEGKPPVEPDPTLSHAANLLWCLTAKKPDELVAKVLDVSLVLYAEHDFNASTFTARVIASTMSDMHSAVCGAIGALKGELHGGANEMAMEMLREIDAYVEAGKGNVQQFMDNAFAEKRKLMGFGHRVYKNGDHRASILRGLGLQVAERVGPAAQRWFEIGDEVQRIMLEQKSIFPNVDFPCGMTYYAMGIPVPVYTPIFVASRVSGWCAHIMEQHQNNRIIRPLAEYTGPKLREWNG